MQQLLANKKMAELLKGASANKATKPAELSKLLSLGIVCEEGCYFLSSLYSQRGNASRELFPDATGYEAYVNHLHLDDFATDSDQLSLSLLYLKMLEQIWSGAEFGGLQICVDVSFDGESCVVRFYLLRTDEQYLHRNLDAYDEAVFLACIGGNEPSVISGYDGMIVEME